jgi:hypothetical protein
MGNFIKLESLSNFIDLLKIILEAKPSIKEGLILHLLNFDWFIIATSITIAITIITIIVVVTIIVIFTIIAIIIIIIK